MSPRERFYSYAVLAVLWGFSPGTLKNWVYQDRRAGIEVAGRYRFTREHRRREFLLREDAARALFDRHFPAL